LAEETITEQLMVEYEEMWNNIEHRLLMVPGKEIIGKLNTYLQEKYGINISSRLIVDSFLREEVPEEMIELISLINKFANQKID
jgi:hypothetical protein